MTRKECLFSATAAVSERGEPYGPPAVNLGRVAVLWNAYLKMVGRELQAHDVALLLDLLKTARLVQSPDHADSWADKAGYAAIGCECATEKAPEWRALDDYNSWVDI